MEFWCSYKNKKYSSQKKWVPKKGPDNLLFFHRKTWSETILIFVESYTGKECLKRRKLSPNLRNRINNENNFYVINNNSKGKDNKIRGFQTLRLVKYFLPPIYNILPTLQSLWDWLLLIDPWGSQQTALQLCLYLSPLD